MRILPASTLLTLAACAAGSTSDDRGTIPQEDVVIPCTSAAVADDAVRWREVRGEGFTFCVPGTWHQAGPRRWQGEGGSITWGTGEPRQRLPFVVRDDPDPTAPAGATRRLSEVIGGRPAELWHRTSRGRHETGAQFRGPGSFHLTGESASVAGAEAQLRAYRTVRFPPG
jgi:hypothetical protein